MVLLGMIILLVVLLAKLLTVINIGNNPVVNSMTGYLIPASVGPMLVAVLLDTRLAYLVAMILAFYVGMLTEGNQLAFALTAFAGGLVGVFGVSRLSQTSDLARSGVYIALANLATFLAVTIIDGSLDLAILGTGSLMGIMNGFLSAVLVIGFLPYLSRPFPLPAWLNCWSYPIPTRKYSGDCW